MHCTPRLVAPRANARPVQQPCPAGRRRWLPGRLLAAFALAWLGAAGAAPALWIADEAGNLAQVDIASGAVSQLRSMGVRMSDIAFDPEGRLFGVTYDAQLFRVDPGSGSATLVGSVGVNGLNSLVFAPDGTLFGASDGLYTIDTRSGAATLVGHGGVAYASSGDLAFAGGVLYLSSTRPNADSLLALDPRSGSAVVVGELGVTSMFGLATSVDAGLYGVAGTSIYAVDTVTGRARFVVDYAGAELGSAYGTAFIAESLAQAVPEPTPWQMLLAALGVAGVIARRRSR